jgi:chitinase
MRIPARRFIDTAFVTVALLIGVVVVIVSARPASAATATFNKYGEWPTGYVGAVTVANDTTAATTNWRVEVDLPAGTSITTHWSALAERTGNHYVFTNLSWNAVVAPGASTTFGFVTEGLGLPAICVAPACDGDREPPSTPGNPRASVSGIEATISWDPSTDNVGVVAYMVYRDDQFVDRTPDTIVRVMLPGPQGFRFSIYAVDAAGNRSAPAIVFATTEQPSPTATTRPPL